MSKFDANRVWLAGMFTFAPFWYKGTGFRIERPGAEHIDRKWSSSMQHDRVMSRPLAVVLVVGLCLAGVGSVAMAAPTGSTDQSAGSNQTIEAAPLGPAPSPRPLTPPPGMSIMPSQPYMAPDTDGAQTQGCPVRNLKPLDLLV